MALGDVQFTHRWPYGIIGGVGYDNNSTSQ